MLITSGHGLAGNWWVIALRGLAALAFGGLALLLPGITLAALILLFGAFALLDGVFSIVSAARAAQHRRRWWTLLLVGVAGIGAGVTTLYLPGVTAIVLLYFIASWAIVRGAFEILAALELRRTISNEWLLILNGAVSILFGALIAIDPGSGAVAIAWLVGVYAIASGILLLGVAWRLRGLSERHIGVYAARR